MRRTWRRSLVAGVASAVLGAMVLCTMMATLAAAPAASSCHESPAEDRHGDTSVAFTCCPSVVKTAAVQVGPECETAVLPPAVEHGGLLAPRPARYADHPPALSESPPLFLRHASLLL